MVGECGQVHVAVVAHNEIIFSTFEQLTALCGTLECFVDPAAALIRLKAKPADITFLEMGAPERASNLSTLVKEMDSTTRVVAITDPEHRPVAIEALKCGAYDFVEKPLEAELLNHVIRRAASDRKKDNELRSLKEALQASQMQLQMQKEQLEYLNVQLPKVNQAFMVFAQNVDREREEIEKKVALRLKSIIIPAIEKLRSEKGLSKYRDELNLLINSIEDMTSGFSANSMIASLLSFTELRVASLIKNGLTTEEIAGRLNVSVSTVRTHRRNIRRKLKLNNSNRSLRDHLNNKWKD